VTVKNAAAGGREIAPVGIQGPIAPIVISRPINVGVHDPVPAVPVGPPLLGRTLGLLEAKSETTRSDRLNSEQRPICLRCCPITSFH